MLSVLLPFVASDYSIGIFNKFFLIIRKQKMYKYLIEVSVPSLEKERTCICVLWVSRLPLFLQLHVGLGIVQIVRYIFVFHFIFINQIPQEGNSATLTGKVLLDTQPPSLLSLTIAKGARLVFDPNTNVHLKVQAIYVDGELHIGSESCPFLSDAHITFYGKYS